MRVRGLKLGLALSLVLGLLAEHTQAQGQAASFAFRNDTQTPVIIQGTSVIGGMIRRGPPILIAPGRVGGDFNLPGGARFYSVYDANQPARVLAKDVLFVVPATGNVIIAVRPLANNQVALEPIAKRP